MKYLPCKIANSQVKKRKPSGCKKIVGLFLLNRKINLNQKAVRLSGEQPSFKKVICRFPSGTGRGWVLSCAYSLLADAEGLETKSFQVGRLRLSRSKAVVVGSLPVGWSGTLALPNGSDRLPRGVRCRKFGFWGCESYG